MSQIVKYQFLETARKEHERESHRIPLKYTKQIKQGQKSDGRNCIYFCEQAKMKFCCKQTDAELTFPGKTLFVNVFLLI